MRDMSKRQFETACKKHGFKPEVFGYYDIGNGYCVSARNAGTNRRAQLAYLIRRKAGKRGEND